MKIFVITPVRGGVPPAVSAYVRRLEAQGHTVFFPPRDTDQTDDGIGLNICRANRRWIELADEVHVWWNPESTGSHFDLGMAFALRKPLRLVNAPHRTLSKSFANVLLECDGR
jgi:nucleoside 2-deoxyribosyltransferase